MLKSHVVKALSSLQAYQGLPENMSTLLFKCNFVYVKYLINIKYQPMKIGDYREITNCFHESDIDEHMQIFFHVGFVIEDLARLTTKIIERNLNKNFLIYGNRRFIVFSYKISIFLLSAYHASQEIVDPLKQLSLLELLLSRNNKDTIYSGCYFPKNGS